jgi:sec-independent protein translocase protein TatB
MPGIVPAFSGGAYEHVMNFLGVGPFEFLLVLILGLIVLGPERLQQMGRSTGRLVARLLAWQQQNPEAQMVQQIRKDLEREIVELRDEMVRARKQLDVSSEVERLRKDTNALMSAQGSTTASQAGAAVVAGKAGSKAQSASSSPPDATPPATDLSDDDLLNHLLHQPETPAEQPRIEGRQGYQHPVDTHTVPHSGRKKTTLNGKAATAEPAESASIDQEHPAVGATASGEALPPVDVHSAPTQPEEAASAPANVSRADLDALAEQVRMLTADMQALQEELREQRMIGSHWRRPSQATSEQVASLSDQ